MYFFFFQAEDGIRDGTVTGVQTCALPISLRGGRGRRRARRREERSLREEHDVGLDRRAEGRVEPGDSAADDDEVCFRSRSEERRVGKEGRTVGAPGQSKRREEQVR